MQTKGCEHGDARTEKNPNVLTDILHEKVIGIIINLGDEVGLCAILDARCSADIILAAKGRFRLQSSGPGY